MLNILSIAFSINIDKSARKREILRLYKDLTDGFEFDL